MIKSVEEVRDTLYRIYDTNLVQLDKEAIDREIESLFSLSKPNLTPYYTAVNQFNKVFIILAKKCIRVPLGLKEISRISDSLLDFRVYIRNLNVRTRNNKTPKETIYGLKGGTVYFDYEEIKRLLNNVSKYFKINNQGRYVNPVPTNRVGLNICLDSFLVFYQYFYTAYSGLVQYALSNSDEVCYNVNGRPFVESRKMYDKGHYITDGERYRDELDYLGKISQIDFCHYPLSYYDLVASSAYYPSINERYEREISKDINDVKHVISLMSLCLNKNQSAKQLEYLSRLDVILSGSNNYYLKDIKEELIDIKQANLIKPSKFLGRMRQWFKQLSLVVS